MGGLQMQHSEWSRAKSPHHSLGVRDIFTAVNGGSFPFPYSCIKKTHDKKNMGTLNVSIKSAKTHYRTY